MKVALHQFDIYPKVFLANREQTITIQPLGKHTAVPPGVPCRIVVEKMNRDNWKQYPEISGRTEHVKEVSADGCLRFTDTFVGEGEFRVWISPVPAPEKQVELAVYALEADMAGRYPYRGDLHVHTACSDGNEAPANVAANYRGYGYDFMAITDHRRYYPSLEAMDTWAELSDLNLVPGEEVHLPLNDVHYVNFGSTYSINALVTPNCNQESNCRSLDGNAPETMSQETYEAMIRERAKNVPLEHESQRMSFASLQWIYEHVQKGDGLGIFPHPYWICPVMQIPEAYTRFIYEQKPFDAFEVLGGENYFAHNGFQTAFYYEMKAKGIDYPVVGSTDTHGSTEHYANALICSTIVFAPKNTRQDLIASIKEKYSVAVDTISKEYRLVGDFRLIKYASFLMENYYPLHDQACKAEGYYMNRVLAGDERAKAVLLAMKGQMAEMQRKYFAL